MLLNYTFVWIDWTDEFNFLYCDRKLFDLLENKEFQIQLKLRQCHHWLCRFIEKIDPLILPKMCHSHIDLLKEWCMYSIDPLHTCLRDFIFLVKKWNNFSIYIQIEKQIDFFHDSYLFLQERVSIEQFLFFRLYDDEWDDCLTLECFDDLKQNTTINKYSERYDIEAKVIEWFKFKKRRFPSHYILYWMINDIEELFCT